MIRQLQEMRWTILVAIFVTLVAAQVVSPLLLEMRQAKMDAAPVVTMQGQVVARDPQSVTIHLWGTKHRACTYIGINSYTSLNGVLRDAHTKRLDGPHTGTTKPVGDFDVGNWFIWPIEGANKVLMYVQHDCSGRVVVTKIAEVDL